MIDVSPESEKLVCGLKGVNQPAERMDIKFGLVSKDQLPKTYRSGIKRLRITMFEFMTCLFFMQDYDGARWENIRRVLAEHTFVLQPECYRTFGSICRIGLHVKLLSFLTQGVKV